MIHMTEQHTNHLHNGKVLRQVRIVADNGTTVRVEALNGPLAGTQYDVDRSELEATPEHKPDPKRINSHCRVDCSCGWKGPQVPMFGHGHQPWVEHFKAVAA
jgi:hypothetical protein